MLRNGSNLLDVTGSDTGNGNASIAGAVNGVLYQLVQIDVDLRIKSFLPSGPGCRPAQE
jgi:hypothetical protein